MIERFIRLPEVKNLTGISKTTIWRLEKIGKFPKSIKVTTRVTVWRYTEIQAFINSFAT
jgi:prophage regulatory protein